MKLDELKQLGLQYTDKITLKTWLIDTSNDTGKATFICINQPDKRKKDFYLIVRFYKCQNQTSINIDEITSINKGWEV